MEGFSVESDWQLIHDGIHLVGHKLWAVSHARRVLCYSWQVDLVLEELLVRAAMWQCCVSTKVPFTRIRAAANTKDACQEHFSSLLITNKTTLN